MAKSGMKFYTARVRINGSLANEATVYGRPAPEIILLQAMHGADAVVDIRIAKKSEITKLPKMFLEDHGLENSPEWTNKVTRDYLAHMYGKAPHVAKRIQELFGSPLSPLPEKLDLAASKPKSEEEFDVDVERRRIRDDLEPELRNKIRAEIEAEEREKIRGELESKKDASAKAKQAALDAMG